MSESLWPDNLQCVATLSFDVDGTSPIVRDPDLSARPSLMSMREYGPSIGVPRILDLLDCFGIKASFYIPGYIAETHPEMTREIVRRGHEIGAHGYKHEPLPGMALEEEARILDKSIRIFEGLTGRAPQGYRAPSWELTPHSLRLFRERGFVYDTSLMGNDVPYHVGTGDGRLLELPVQWILDDAPFFSYPPGERGPQPMASPQHVYEVWSQEFEGLYRYGRYFMLTMHPWITGRPSRLLLLERLIRFIYDHPRVAFWRAIDVAEYWIGR